MRSDEGSSYRSSTVIGMPLESMVRSNIYDLPELLLVEILCRLPCSKFVFQCKCVSKHWCELISTPQFVCHFVRLQCDLQKPILSTIVVGTGTFFPVLESTLRSKSRGEKGEEKILSSLPSLNLRLPLVSELKQLYVLGACNDLLLCSPTESDQRDYYICNPYTKQWVALPPPCRVHNFVDAGFICDPYYNYSSPSSSNKGLDGASCHTNIVQLNTEYRWRVVRILPDFYVEIFFSETGEWRESVNVVCHRDYTDVYCPPIAYNGKLYWTGTDEYTAFTFELDPFNSTSTAEGGIIVDKCRLTLGPLECPSEGPVPCAGPLHMCLGACRGCLRVCSRTPGNLISVWELEEEVNDLVDVEASENLKWRLVVDTFSFSQMDSDVKLPFRINGFKSVLAFHPTNEDIVYFDDDTQIIMCNLGTRTAELVPGIPIFLNYWTFNYIHPFVLPWWPTPVPRL